MKRFIACAFIIFALMLQLCSIGGDKLAGGSGAGNPGGATTVAIRADTTIGETASDNNGLNKSKAETDDLNRVLRLADDDSMKFAAASAKITVYKIYFMLDDATECENLIKGFGENCRCVSDGIVLEGTFVFNAITEKVDALFDTLKLPVAKYRGIKLIIGCSEESNSKKCEPIEISGTFLYRDTTRAFRFNISFSTMLLHKYIGPPTLIDPEYNTLFEINLNAKNWISGLDFEARLNDGTIKLDSLGNLSLHAHDVSDNEKAITNTIRKNISDSFQSAQLKIKSSR